MLLKLSKESLNLKETVSEKGLKAKKIVSVEELKQKKNFSIIKEICKKKIPQTKTRKRTKK